MYHVIHLTETDGEPVIFSALHKEDVKSYVKRKQLSWEDFQMIKGGNKVSNTYCKQLAK